MSATSLWLANQKVSCAEQVVTEQIQSNETVFLHPPGVDEECDEARASLASLPR